MKSLSGNHGFTLVELMVVVAIIGILSAIAVPNYQKFQAKARQTEAKIGLAGLYSAEMSYSSESGTFSGCLPEVGFSMPGSGVRYYSVGFALGSANNCGPRGDSDCRNRFPGGVTTACTPAPNNQDWRECYWSNAKVGSGPISACSDITQNQMTSSTFTAEALGTISSTTTNSATTDRWTMTHEKILVNTRSGF